MGSRSFVVEGRGNEHAFCSCSHGAGRAMSRAEAMRAISDEELCRSMEGVLYDHDGRLRDEAPAAYKDIGQVMRAQRDLVRIKHELRPMASIKGCT
jgi:tRNA-splicing ligase RtcB